MNLTEHFTLEEFIFSQTAIRFDIDNTIPKELFPNLKQLAESLENVRRVLSKPILISSGYRSYTLNRTIGGSKNSQHCLGRAVDFISPAFGTPLEVCRAIANSKWIDFDQVIHEYGRWCHFGISEAPMRKELLTIKTYSEGYLPGLLEV